MIGVVGSDERCAPVVWLGSGGIRKGAVVEEQVLVKGKVVQRLERFLCG